MAPTWSVKAAALVEARHKLRKYNGGVSRLRMVDQVVLPCLNEGAPTSSPSQHPEPLREHSCRLSDFYGQPQRLWLMRSPSQPRPGELLQWRQ